MIGTVAMGQCHKIKWVAFGQPGGGGGPDAQGGFGNHRHPGTERRKALAGQEAQEAVDSAGPEEEVLAVEEAEDAEVEADGRRNVELRESMRSWERSVCYANVSIARTTVSSIPLGIPH